MKTALKWLLLILLLLLVVIYFGGSWYFSNILINRETQTLAEGQARADGDEALPAPEVVSIDTGEVTLAGNFYDNPQDGQCAVILLHGYTGTRYGALQYAPLFWPRGCDLLAYDARGHGDSTPSFHTYGYHEKQDTKAALDWLLKRTGLEDKQVGLVGVSYGAATALQTAPLAPDIAFVLADSSYQDLQTIVSYQAAAQFGNWVKLFVPGAFFLSELRADFDAAAVSPKDAAAQVTTPILLIHSLQDTYTTSTQSEAVYAGSHQDSTELVITDWGAPHGQSIEYRPDEFATIVSDFLATYAPDFGVTEP